MIGVIGCGNMGEAIIAGIKARYKRGEIVAYDKDIKKLNRIKSKHKVPATKKPLELSAKSKTILIAVKPQDINTVLDTLKDSYKNQLIISIAAGISTSYIEKYLDKRARVVRVMPNLAAKVAKSISAISKGRFASKSDLTKAKKIFENIGQTLEIKEKYMDAVTAVSGSGPGYIFYFLYCLQEAARGLGFSKREAKELVLQTFKGAAELVSEKDDFLKLVNQVACKGGTTEAALKQFKKKNLKNTTISAVRKGCQRANKLSK